MNGNGRHRAERGAPARSVWRVLMGMLLAVATLMAMALPMSAVYAADGDDANCAATTLPVKRDGTSVTWSEVRDYIDANFTGSKVFADAVYDAICTSGQDFSRKDYGDRHNTTLRTAEDVIRNYGIFDSRNTVLTLTKPLEDGAVLTGIGQLRYVSTLNVKDVGNHKGLDFLEDAYEPIAGSRPTEKDPMGPAAVVENIAITELPQNPYALNLPRTIGANNHYFPTTAYNSLLVSILRRPGGAKSTTVNIDTALTGRDGTPVELGTSVVAASTADTSFTAAADVVYPTETNMVWNDDFGCDPWRVSSCPQTEGDSFQASGNHLTVTIPSDVSDNKTYWSRLAFSLIYKFYSNTVMDQTSVDYFYRTSAEYLNRVTVSGSQMVISGARVKKVDKDDPSKGLNGATFELYADSGGTQKAKQADLTTDGKPQFNADGSLAVIETGTYTSGNVEGTDGVVVLDNLLPGTYYLKEVTPPDGYTAVSDQLIPVIVEDVDTKTPEVTGGESAEAEVAKDGATVQARADKFEGYRRFAFWCVWVVV
ncbi:hypothetical protein G1C96_1620 [Bifidobacterium sp. DSM 109958]|uniref:SpaA-like prealbumin fold domain-containing protein n=1 Tax=Bifidobacterium moraviense TaxID=2675323 RepID=A0A7Y0F2Y2_9BIFI|nr:prealbumin-like fold domain-containing protein [Bifidobacterium sp. DSM 109958]NMN01038.1 hypothetical protein [Bifidobacterium sp. DSM 109958]